MIPDQILKAYDIRGTYGVNLNESIAKDIGRALGHFIKEQSGAEVVIGHDGRHSSPGLSLAFKEGLLSQGINILDIGLCPTPMVWFALHLMGFNAGVMVTASHNPPQDNGFKMALLERPLTLEDFKEIFHSIPQSTSPVKGQTQSLDMTGFYAKRILKDYQPREKRIKIVWDPSHSSIIPALKEIVPALNAECWMINDQVDGSFPAHEPDPSVPKNLEQLKKEVLDRGADLGIAFDGDGDRLGVIDSQGQFWTADQLMMIWAEDILSQNKNATFIGDIKCSNALKNFIEEKNGTFLFSRTGHSYIKKKIKEVGALLAGEVSGHVFFADRYYGFDDALYAAIRLLNCLHQKPLNERTFPKMFLSPEFKWSCEDEKKFKFIEELKHLLDRKGIAFNDTDGIRLETEEGWWLLRASNTQALLAGRCEGNSPQALEKMEQNLKSYVEEIYAYPRFRA